MLFVDKRPTLAQVELQVRKELPVGSGDIDVYFFFDHGGNLMGYVFKRWLWAL